MKENILNLTSLNDDEKRSIEGGIVEPVSGTVIAVAGLALTMYATALAGAYYIGYYMGKNS